MINVGTATLGALIGAGGYGQPILTGVGHAQKLVFRVLAMIMWAAPIGAFGGMAYTVAQFGGAADRPGRAGGSRA